MLHSSSPSLIFLLISMCFVTVPNAPVTTGITFTFVIFQSFAISYVNSVYFVHFSFLSMWVTNGHAGSVSRHFLLLSITAVSVQLCSRVLSVCIGKSHKIWQSSESKIFPGLCMYYLSALLNPNFSQGFQYII